MTNSLQSLKIAYDLALLNNEDVFIWQGREVLTAYAKYLIEYLSQPQNAEKGIIVEKEDD